VTTNWGFQVAECIKKLQTDSQLPIQRARMRVRVSVPVDQSNQVREKVLKCAEEVEVDNTGPDEWQTVGIQLSCQ
jgi:ribosome maturation protein SDO1